MGTVRGIKILLATLCLSTLTCYVEGGTTWLMYFTSTASTLDWENLKASFGTNPALNYTTQRLWAFLTTTTLPPTTSTIPTTTMAVTDPPKEPEIIESTDTIFLIIIIITCIIGLFVAGFLVIMIYKMSQSKKKKTKRLRVKPLKADQAFAPVPHPGMGMGMPGMGMGMGDPMGMGGMPGLMPPMETGLMGMPGMMGLEDMDMGMDYDPNAPTGMGKPGAADWANVDMKG